MSIVPNQYFAGKKIMWVEDDEFFGSLMVRKLSELGCVLVYIPTGEEAVRIIEKEMPDLLIVDILLPGIDGFSIMEQVKANPTLAHIPILVFSNMDDRDYMRKAKNMGAEGYFVKTELNLSQMTTEIENVLKQHHSEDAAVATQ